MPELPEVETIANLLRQGTESQPAIIGKKITGARLLWERCLATPTFPEFKQRLIGQEIQKIWRRGKFLCLSLPSDILLIHLRMSGDLLVEPESAPVLTHHRLILNLEGGVRLAFNDARKFGRVWLVVDPATVFGDLGPEPLDPSFTALDLFHRLQASRRQIKPLLIDQSFVAGVGNIYADETLHHAKLHPLTPSHTLTFSQAERLHHSLRQVLEEGIRRNGTSIDWVYRGGDFQNYLRVYQRTGEPCLVCGTPIQKMIVGQRGTHFCPVCQPYPVLIPEAHRS
jgi:formamidopyrimidine-DNA glycosylase